MKGGSQDSAVAQRLPERPADSNQSALLHARMARNWGLGGFNDYEYGRSIKAMSRMADSLIEAGVVPRRPTQPAGPGQAADRRERPEMLGATCRCDRHARPVQDTIRQCEEARDFVSRDELSEIPRGDRGAHRLGRVPAMADHECRPPRTTCSRRWGLIMKGKKVIGQLQGC